MTRRAFAAMSLVGATACSVGRQSRTSTPLQAGASAIFHEEVQAYLAVRREAQQTLPPLSTSARPEEIVNFTTALGSRIAELRKDAPPGQVLSMAVVGRLREIATEELTTRKDELAAVKLGNPVFEAGGPEVPLAVNAIYPDAAPVSFMPPALLHRFPKLPAALEYRFVGRALVIRDRLANIIVDFAREVAPPL